MAVQREPLSRSDGEIDNDVRETLRWDMRIDDCTLDVAVTGGEVRLTGWVGTMSEKVAAREDAARIKGVRSVIDEIAVRPQVLRRDEDIARDVVDALHRDRRLDPGDVAVSVQNGIVHLSGTVSTLAQQRDAAEDAWYTAGIVDLVNELRVVPPRRRSDAELVGAVRSALNLSGRIADPERIEVCADEGTVVLQGSVESERERYAAGEAVRLISGVVDLVDDLVVSASPRHVR